MRAHRRRLIAVGLFVACAFLAAAALARVDAAPVARIAFANDPEAGPVKGEEHEKQQQREIDTRLHSDGSGKLRPDLYRKASKAFAGLADRREPHAAREVRAQGADDRGRAAAGGGGVVGVQWTQIGPAPLVIDAEQNYQGQGPDAGQVVSIAIDPRNTTDKVIYVGLQRRRRLEDDRRRRHVDAEDGLHADALDRRARARPGEPVDRLRGHRQPLQQRLLQGGRRLPLDRLGGDTWSLTSGSSALNGKGVNFIVMPAADTLLVATNQGLFRSTNAGGIFTQVSVGGTSGRVHHRPRPRHAEPEHRLRGRLRAGDLRLDGRRCRRSRRRATSGARRTPARRASPGSASSRSPRARP